ncbi:MAG: CYTH domain-containing protein [Saonia sp.]
MIEIERKFLVNSKAYKTEAFLTERITQGFLNTNPERTVRVRIKGDTGFLTVKGKSNPSGTSRFEWEKEITVDEAEALLDLCEEGIVDKLRYCIKKENHILEVDEFLGNNEGLILAEVELRHEEEKFERPNWLHTEVTGDIRYYNSQLSKQPYKNWKK